MLGPRLFLVFINNIENELTCNHKFFADGVVVVVVVVETWRLGPLEKGFPSKR